MPDITMCKGGNCPLKYSCKRYMSLPDEWQAFFAHVPYNKDGCEHYWDCGDAINTAEKSA